MSHSVCIAFAEALSAPEVVWSLADAGYRVSAIARRGRRSPLRHSKYVRVLEITPPEVDCEVSRREFAEILDVLSIQGEEQLFMPLDDAAVWLSGQTKLLPGSWACAGAGGELAPIALDKCTQVKVAKVVGFRVPETACVTTSDELIRFVDRLPIIFRPARAVWQCGIRLTGGRHRICATRAELEKAILDWKAEYPVLVQPFIRGTGEGVFGLATGNGVEAWSAHRRVRMVNPQGSGSSACVSAEVPEDLKEQVESFVSATQWRGIFMFEFLRDVQGTAWFVEFNGRAWGSMALSRRMGFEYPAWNANLAAGHEWAIKTPIKGRDPVLCRHMGREWVHLLFILRGPRSTAFREWPSFWRSFFNVFHIRRQDALYNWRRDDKAVFFSDCWYTVSHSLARGFK